MPVGGVDQRRLLTADFVETDWNWLKLIRTCCCCMCAPQPGVYGDVHRVKILFNKKDTALIQMAEPHQAQLGRNTNFVWEIKSPVLIGSDSLTLQPWLIWISWRCTANKCGPCRPSIREFKCPRRASPTPASPRTSPTLRCTVSRSQGARTTRTSTHHHPRSISLIFRKNLTRNDLERSRAHDELVACLQTQCHGGWNQKCIYCSRFCATGLQILPVSGTTSSLLSCCIISNVLINLN